MKRVSYRKKNVEKSKQGVLSGLIPLSYLGMRSGILLSCSFFLFSGLLAQEVKPAKTKMISVNEFYITASGWNEVATNTGLSDFKLLAPRSVLLNKDFTNFNFSGGKYYSSESLFSMLVGINFFNYEKKAPRTNPLLRLGVSYVSGTMLSGNISKDYRVPFDTLSSSHGSSSIYVDSVFGNQLGMYYSSEQLRLDASLIFRSKPEARWSLFAGFGVSTGISLNAHTEITNYQMKGVEMTDNSGGENTSFRNASSNVSFSERFENDMNFGFSAYVPMGVDFRIGKKHDFWKQIHLFYEMRPNITFTNIPELKMYSSAFVQQGLGLKFVWN